MGKIILDLDDFSLDQKRNALNWLFEFKGKYPNFKATMFTIYRFCSKSFLKEIAKLEWLELAAHGLTHETNDEVYFWDKKQWHYVLDNYEDRGCFVKGFKAPNWQMTQHGYEVLKKRGWWVAVRGGQVEELPTGIKYYSFERNPNGVHGHTWLMANHLAEKKFDWDDKTTFEFVSQNLEVK